MPRKFNLLLVIEMLIPKKDDFPLQQCCPNALHLLRFKRTGQIDVVNLGADVHREGTHANHKVITLLVTKPSGT